VSSDVFFYKLGYQFWVQQPKYGSQPIENVAAQYGYGQPTGIDLYEQSYAEVDSPTLRVQQHKSHPKAFPYSNWTPDDNIELAFGQGETIITPLEQAIAYGTFANGGTRYAPEIAAGILSASGKVVQTIEPKVMSHVKLPANVYGPILTGLEDVISQPDGTGYPAFQGFPLSTFQLAGKTGTASVNNQQPDSWFVAFGPEPNPKYVVAAVVDQGGYGADAAAPIVRDIFNYLLTHPVGPVQLKLPSTTAGVKSSGT
jgi:penicillin-binding protein 2